MKNIDEKLILVITLLGAFIIARWIIAVVECAVALKLGDF